MLFRSIGIRSDSAPIAKIGFSIDAAAANTADFAINRFDFAPAAVVPEPSTLVLSGLGLFSLIGYRLRSRRRA